MRIMETKALVCDIEPGRRPRGPAVVEQWQENIGATGMSSATITGFLTDSTLCIGCKACEVACKEWNGIAEDGLELERLLLRQHGRARTLDVAAREVCRRRARAGLRRQRRRAHVLGVFFRRLQALRGRRMPGGVSHRLDRPHRIRRRLRAAGCLQRLRILRCRRVHSAWSSATKKMGEHSSALSAMTGRRLD